MILAYARPNLHLSSMLHTPPPLEDTQNVAAGTVDALAGGLSMRPQTDGPSRVLQDHNPNTHVDFKSDYYSFLGSHTIPTKSFDYPPFIPASPPGGAYLRSPTRERPGLDNEYVQESVFKIFPSGYRHLFNKRWPCESSAEQTRMILRDLAESKAIMKAARESLVEDVLSEPVADSEKDDSVEEDDSVRRRGQKRKRKDSAEGEERTRKVAAGRSRRQVAARSSNAQLRQKQFGGEVLKF